MNRRFYVFCEDSKSIRVQQVARQPPAMIYSFKDSQREGRVASTLYPALDGKLLILRKNNTTLELLGLEYESGLLSGHDGQVKFGHIESLTVFGPLDDHMAVVCLEGMNVSLKVMRIVSGDGKYSAKEVSSCQLGKKMTKDNKYNVTVCPKSRVIAVNCHTPDLGNDLSSNVVLKFVEYIDDRVRVIAEFEKADPKGVGEFRGMSFLNYYHNVLVLTGIDYSDKSRIFTFLLDTENNKVHEREDLRAFSGVSKVAGIENFGQSRFRGSDNQARIFEVTYRLIEDGGLIAI